MPRNLILLAVLIGAVAFAGLYVLPWAKSKFFGEAMSVRVTFTKAFEDHDIEVPGTGATVARTVVTMEIDFPMGSAPESVSDLLVQDDNGQLVDVNWGSTPLDKEDLPERGVTHWVIREAFFPIGFRQGLLKTQVRDLVYMKLPQIRAQDITGR